MEADVLHHNGSYYFFFNNWDSCPGRDCCNTSGGCWSCCFRGGGSDARQRFPFASVTPPLQPPDPDCTDWFNHTVVAYRSSDLVSFEPLGTVFAPKFAVQQGVIIYRCRRRRLISTFVSAHAPVAGVVSARTGCAGGLVWRSGEEEDASPGAAAAAAAAAA
jgi:hypothetical protein